MHKYIWNLGFDFNSVQGRDTLSYLQNGLVLLNPPDTEGKPDPRTPASPVNLNPDDTVGFNVFNLTDGAAADGYSIVNGLITFRFASVGQGGTPCPFNPHADVKSGQGDLPPIQITESSSTIQFFFKAPAPNRGTSVIFSGLQKQVEFPWWPVVLGIPLHNRNAFLMTIALMVKGPEDAHRTFVVDPEMITGSAG